MLSNTSYLYFSLINQICSLSSNFYNYSEKIINMQLHEFLSPICGLRSNIFISKSLRMHSILVNSIVVDLNILILN